VGVERRVKRVISNIDICWHFENFKDRVKRNFGSVIRNSLWLHTISIEYFIFGHF